MSPRNSKGFEARRLKLHVPQGCALDGADSRWCNQDLARSIRHEEIGSVPVGRVDERAESGQSRKRIAVRCVGGATTTSDDEQLEITGQLTIERDRSRGPSGQAKTLKRVSKSLRNKKQHPPGGPYKVDRGTGPQNRRTDVWPESFSAKNRERIRVTDLDSSPQPSTADVPGL